MSTANSYDDVLYPNYVHHQTHPDHLAAIATLHGMRPKPVAIARVLELACGQGGNLIPLAVAFPQASFLGIDLSQRQIEQGQETTCALGLKNIELRQYDILEFSSDEGQFDYIIAHGVFSWVPAHVRDKILAVCRENLAAQGVAIVSYNTYPGWHQRRMIRDMMRFHVKQFDESQKQIEQAKAFLSFMTKAVPDESAYGKSLHEEFRSLSQVDCAYLFHEQLEKVNDPVYFHEFAAQAANHQLQYLSEVEMSNALLEQYPPQVAEVLSKMPIVEREQYIDFFVRRTFRQTLLCRNEVQLDRANWTKYVADMRASSPVLANRAFSAELLREPLEITGQRNMKATIRDPLAKAALFALGKVWPASVPLTVLFSEARRLVSGENIVVQSQAEFEHESLSLIHSIVHAFMAGMVRLQTVNPPFVVEPSDRPRACPLVRHQAAQGTRVTSRLHRSVELDILSQQIVLNLDGQTTRADLLARIVQYVQEQKIVIQKEGRVLFTQQELQTEIDQRMESALNHLRQQALLVE